MKYIKLYENFSIKDFNDRLDRNYHYAIMETIDKYIEDIINNGDIKSLKYLIDKYIEDIKIGYIENDMLSLSLNRDNLDIFNYLIKKIGLHGFRFRNIINAYFDLGEKTPERISEKEIRNVKLLVNNGYKLNDRDIRSFTKLIKGSGGKRGLRENSFDILVWLIERDSSLYYYLEKVIDERLRERFGYLDKVKKYNI